MKENNFEGRVSVDNLNNPDNIGVANLCDDYNDYPDDFTLKLGDEPVKNYLLGGDYPVDLTANPKLNLVTSFVSYSNAFQCKSKRDRQYQDCILQQMSLHRDLSSSRVQIFPSLLLPEKLDFLLL